MNVDVHFLPTDAIAAELAGRTVVVIDILRATTTIVRSLASGAREVIPCLEIDEARRIAEQLGHDALLGGERGGIRIPGFQLGNSPAEYSPEVVSGRSIVITTTNGTRAMRVCGQASRVLIGSFLNLSTVVNELQSRTRVSLVCAGTDGRFTREDALFAGAILANLGPIDQLNDEAQLALGAWTALGGSSISPQKLVTAMNFSRGGRNLIELGYENDVSLAAQIDACPLVAELRTDNWRIVRA